MRLLRIAFSLFAFFGLMLPAQAAPAINVVPEPNHVVMGHGEFGLSGNTVIVCPRGIERLGKYLDGQIKFFTHLDLRVNGRAPRATNVIVLELERSFKGPDREAYALTVSPDRVVLKAGAEVGLFRGIQTLLQLIPLPARESGSVYKLPACSIKDHPRFGWRGLNLDCVRHFMTKDFIKRYIDLLAYYKFNVFHWHFTDDQGWRIQIKKYPKLTEVGAWRVGPDGKKYGGYYTQKDIREIVAYAKSRFITVVPEIEMPGHCQASLASYPENACIPGPFEVATQWGVHKNIYCPAKKSTYTFLENILTEVMRLFPSHYIHIGGDEVPKTEWKDSKLCQQFMKEKGLDSTDQLQSYFVRRIQKFLESKGRQIIGWNEILEGGGPLPGAVVESWQGISGAIKAVQNGDYTIVSPGEYTYLSRDADGLGIDSVYSFDPMPPGLTPAQQKHVLGTEASMWSEHAPQPTVDSKMFPRLLAMAEDAWTNTDMKNFADFHRRLQVQYRRLSYLGVDYGLERKAMSYKTTFDRAEKKFTISLTQMQSGISLRYAVADSLTMENSRPYEAPVSIDTTATFIAQAVMNGKLVGNPLRLSFVIDKALDSRVTLKNPYSPRYTAGGPGGLVDGIRGTASFMDGLWQGFKGTDLDATVDMKEEKKISEIGAGFLQVSSSYIFMPEYVEFYVSKDGKNFERVGTVRNDVSEKDPDTVIKDFKVSFDPTEARYVRVVAKNIGVCPPWHPGAGSEAWIFTDEIYAR